MLDIRFIRQNPDLVQQVANGKGIAMNVRELILWDETRLRLQKESELLRQRRNALSRQIGNRTQRENREEAEKAREEVEKAKEEVRQIHARLASLETELLEAEQHFHRLMLLVPNIVSPDTPAGSSDADNVEVKRVGEPPRFDFPAKDHVELGELLDIVDIPRGVKVAGTRNYVLKGAGCLLHRAVQQLAVDMLTERGFTLLDAPLIVRGDALVHTGFFPLGEEQTFRIDQEDKWLIGTSEVSLVSYFSDEVVDVTQPVKVAAVTPCFRKEVGSAGKDVRGLYRVHQFSKVEQVVLCRNDPALAEQLLQEITRNAEDLLQLLELPYRIVAVCTGDMAQKTYKQYDIETWMPSRQSYGETHSSSNLLDFQARRANIRYREGEGKPVYCYTLNNTAIASPRILIPLLEVHQREDGSVAIPKALRKYMNGMEELRPPRSTLEAR